MRNQLAGKDGRAFTKCIVRSARLARARAQKISYSGPKSIFQGAEHAIGSFTNRSSKDKRRREFGTEPDSYSREKNQI